MRKKYTTFLVTINWYGEIHKFFTVCKEEKTALRNAVRQLSIKLDLPYAGVSLMVINPLTDRWKVKEVKK